MGQAGHNDWKGTTGGQTWMQQAMKRSLRWMPLWFVYAGMALVIPFYMLLAHKGYISIYHYFRRQHGYGPLKAFVNVYANHFLFGAVILDRFAMYAGKRFDIRIDHYDEFLRLADEKGGFLMLSAHVGNYELAGYSLVSEKKPFNALVFGGETETVMANRREMFRHAHIRMIPVSDDMSHIFAVNNALADGEIVSMPADRIFGSAKYVKARLLGSGVRLPKGPFVMTTAREVPALAVFVMKTSLKGYQIHIRRLSATDKAGELAREYAGCLDGILRKYPRQWFNFYAYFDPKDETAGH